MVLAASVSTIGAMSIANAQNAQQANKMEEVIVTAQKRVENLQDVPVPVTAINAEQLVEANRLRLQDYYTKVPGLNLTLFGDGSTPQVTIRGITTGAQSNPTVGITVDDVPYGSSTSVGGFFAPDIDPSDLQRVEVLRGPQGTLYGASSLGGLIKYVTVDPSTAKAEGRLQVGSTSVHGSDEFGYSVRGSANVPLGETLAVRVSGYMRQEPGYVDDPIRGAEDVNTVHAEGGRVAALWQPSDAFTAKFSALLQRAKQDGSGQVHRRPGYGDLEQNALPNTGGYDHRIEAYTATLDWKLGSSQLTSISGYSVDTLLTKLDGTPLLGFFTLPRFGVPGTVSRVNTETTKFSQELRLYMPIGERIEWLIGGFYTHEKIPADQQILAVDASQQVVGAVFVNDGPFKFEEQAAFTNFTYHFTDRFDVQIGGRGSQLTRTDGPITAVGPLVVGGASLTPKVEGEDTAVTYLLTPRFKVSPDLMVYARLASGYRAGGPNVNVTVLSGLGLPLAYDSDTTQNYEIGMKGSALGGSLSFDASIFYIDWKDIQIQLRDPGSLQVYSGNGSRAKSEGIELSLDANPLDGLRIATWMSWNRAELTEDFPPGPAIGQSGDRLPYSPRFSGGLSVEQQFPVATGLTGFIGSSVTYVGDRVGVFRTVAQRQAHPSYSQVDLQLGVRNDSWAINAFANNLTDKRGVLRGGLDRPAALTYAFDYIQPRTIGLAVTKSFQ